MTLKEAQALLRAWGKFWRSKEYGTGYGSTSITYHMMQTGLLGPAGKSTKHLFNHLSESMHVPDWVDAVDRTVSLLTTAEKCVINQQYIKGRVPTSALKKSLVMAELKFSQLC
jgi:hypothetical protein